MTSVNSIIQFYCVFIICCIWKISVSIKLAELKAIPYLYNNTNSSNSDSVLITYESSLHELGLHGFCFSDISEKNLPDFSLSLCQHFGFQTLSKFYPVSLETFAIGSYTNVTCPDVLTSLSDCEWQSQRNSSCHKFLAVDCSYCKESVRINETEQYIIEIPPHNDCSAISYCEWNITQNKPSTKVTVLEINKNSSNFSSPKENHSNGYLEIKWFDDKGSRWNVKRYNATDFTGDLSVPTNMLVVRFISKNNYCKLFGNNVVHVLVQSQNLDIIENTLSDTYSAFIVLIFVVGSTIASFTCICCTLWKRKKTRIFHRKSYLLTNRSDLDFLYGRQTNQHLIAKDSELMVKFSPSPKSQFGPSGSEPEVTAQEEKEDGVMDEQEEYASVARIVRKYSDPVLPPSKLYSAKGYLHRMVSLSDEDSRSSVWESVISDQDTRLCLSSNSEGSFCSVQHLDNTSCTCSESDIFRSLEYIHKK